MARRYEVEGTKSYLIAAWVLAALSLWHIIDGWVPQARWRGREASAIVTLDEGSLLVQAVRVGTNLNGTVVRVMAASEMLVPDDASVQVEKQDGRLDIWFQPGQATMADLLAAVDALEPLTARPLDDEFPVDRVLSGPARLEVELVHGREGKYPDFPESWHDFRLHEFYAYNRYTGVLMAIAAIVCAYIHRVVK